MQLPVKSLSCWEKLSGVVTATEIPPIALLVCHLWPHDESAIHIEVLSRVFSWPGVEALASSSSGGGSSNFKEDFGVGALKKPTRALEFAA